MGNVSTVKNEELSKEYFLYLCNVRNDFYSRGLFKQAEQVQKDIDKLSA